MRAVTLVSLLLLSLVAALVVAVPPASAKGPAAVTITGPGLDEPIEVELTSPGSRDVPSYLVIALMELAGPFGPDTDQLPLEPGQPPRRLNDAYTLTWQMSRPPDADPADYQVVQEVYPDAMGIPVIHFLPSTWRDDQGGWRDSTPALRDTLAALGVPIEVASAGTPLRSPAPAAASNDVAEAVGDAADSDGAAWWSLPIVAVAGMGAGVAVGRRRPRDRRRPSAAA
jgi:hypothetical protein